MREKYLELLSEQFPTEEEIVTEIINLEAILNLPKATEHFVSDLHGEYDAFDHVLRNGSGNVKVKIKALYEDKLSEHELQELITLVYYPEEKIIDYKRIHRKLDDLHQWYSTTLTRLVEITTYCASKYTRSKVRKSLPERFAYIMEELLYNLDNTIDKDDYYNEVIDKVIELRQADHLITAFCYVIQRLVVDHLHVVGDIYDRGPNPDKIMERLMTHHSVDIQWGNHDMLWMGAVCGSRVCMANLLRICARYDNLDIVEDVYGINLRPLLTLADKYYDDNPAFRPKSVSGKRKSSMDETLQATKIHQAITMIQFKLEKEIIDRRPEFHMESRLLLENVNFADCTITLKGKTYPLQNTCFALVDPKNPCKLSPEEEQVVDKLLFAFQSSEKLLRHVNFLFRNGSLYLVYNNNLLIHGCVPLDDHGKLESMVLEGKSYTGPDLLDCFEYHVRRSYRKPRITDDFSTDLIWYLWSGAKSSLFGKREMTTFERYFIEDKATHKEIMNPYYQLRDNEEVCNYILSSFGIDAKKGHIVNGHTPVREIKGESPIKGNGKTIVIDGGYSRVYQKETGIGGYTLLYNSYGMELAAHQPFTSREDAIRNGTDIISSRRVVDEEIRRQKISETNIGELLCSRSADLHELLEYTHSRRKFQK